MDSAKKPGGETSMPAQAEEHTETKSRKSPRRHKPRDGKRRGTSSSDDGTGKSVDSAASQTPSSSKTGTHSSKSSDKGAPESQKPPEAAPASTAALPSHTSTTQDAPKPPEAKMQRPPPARTGPSATKVHVAPPTGERKHDRAFLATVVTTALIMIGVALALVGIMLGATPPDVQHVCPPPDKPLAEDTVLLATKGGRLVGRTVTVDGVALTRFLGVPFAHGTAGLRRFLVPLPMGPPQDPCAVHEHLEPRPPCVQWSNGSVIGSEDCLHVNVWMPAATTGGNGTGGGRALVVAVSGSWFETGSNDDPDWPQLAAKGNVVVMAPNHRQGVLGFLHPSPVAGVVQDPAVDDVVYAVQWALDNAKFFGADSKQLVLVGRGSGAYLLSMASSCMPNGTALRAFYHGMVYGSPLPLNPRHGNASTSEALLDFTLNVFNVPSLVQSFLKSQFNIASMENFVLLLPCWTLRAATAAVEGYHYLFDSATASGLLHPPVGIPQLAQFVSLGTAPPLADNSPWLPLSELRKTRFIGKDGHENLTNLDNDCKI
ncbi:uncharacterized protein [Dermacentor albipictus]|uniref:uncharacterized protein isoform X2 n=1 Tax=Dermacentor albipictus TaxID=60249 RepID=UPI0031FCB058